MYVYIPYVFEALAGVYTACMLAISYNNTQQLAEQLYSDESTRELLAVGSDQDDYEIDKKYEMVCDLMQPISYW